MAVLPFLFSQNYVFSVAVSPDGAWVASGSKDRGVQFWNPKDAQAQFMLQGHKGSGEFHHHRSAFFLLLLFEMTSRRPLCIVLAQCPQSTSALLVVY
jgi:WD40 repeat protein